MKKIVCLGIILSVLMIFGCGKATVEDEAKDFVKKQFNFDNTVKLDTSKLKYAVTQEKDNKATVKVSGTIDYEGQIFLIKEGGKWKIAKEKGAQVQQDVIH